MSEEFGGVMQFFYHCKDQILPIRDILNTNGKGNKTEPHYENLTENWCNKCMNPRIRSVNSKQLDYLFLFTKYQYSNHKYYNKYFIVGYLKRADSKRFLELNDTLRSDVNLFDLDDPNSCGFFAGDKRQSIFVSINDAYLIKDMQNPRHYPWLVSKSETKVIIKHFENKKNIISELVLLAKKLTKKKGSNESCSTACRN